MVNAFANITFTENVKQFQSSMGSREQYEQFDTAPAESVRLSVLEKTFIEQRDSFYQATVSQNGWPYVQHRGGPKGFLKIIDEQTIGYTDFTGNRQYLSVGNLIGDDRICLFLIDYQQQRRLKIWGRARLINLHTEPDMIAQLEPDHFRAPIERGVVINIEAFDWNCPKYITPRYTQAEVEALLAEHQLQSDMNHRAYHYQGAGIIPAMIASVTQITDNVRTYTLKHREHKPLPKFEAGAHINVPVQLADGSKVVRSYSLINQQSTIEYKIAVKEETSGEGGSATIHQHWQVGTELNIDAPQNHFGLHSDERPALLIAGGIGITAIMAMAATLKQRKVDFQLHYTSQTHEGMAFRTHLLQRYPDQCHLYFSREANANKLAVSQLIEAASPQTVIYICGPKSLLEQARKTSDALSKPIHYESYL